MGALGEMTAMGVGGGKRFYRPELDVLRFVAFLLVFWHHAPFPGFRDTGVEATRLAVGFHMACSCGLPLFFALSAFLICELLLKEKEQAGRIRMKAFYVRRVLRIWPLYLLGIAIGCGFIVLVTHHLRDLYQMLAMTLMAGNWWAVIYGFSHGPVEPLWSISVEEQFYLFSPWMVQTLSRRGLYWMSAVLIALANGWLFFLGRFHAGDDAIWANSFVQFEMFAAGLLLCLVLRGRTPVLAGWVRMLLFAAALGCWWVATTTFNIRLRLEFARVGSWGLMAGFGMVAVGCVLLLVAFLGLPARWLPGPAIWLGRVSFGLYVYHQIALKIFDRVMLRWSMQADFALRSVCALALTVVLAGLSYRWLETPFLRMKGRFEVIRTRPI